MAMDKRKRALPPKVAAMKAKKRQKLAALHSEDADAENAQRSNRVTDLNSLSWKEVSMPDRLEDYEGFAGLEEIDDVEVIRDQLNGKMSYYRKPVAKPLAKNSNMEGENEEASAEWSGFDDEDGNGAAHESIKKSTVKSSSKEPKKAKSKTKSETSVAQSQDPHVPEGGYTSLMNHSEDEGVDVSAWRELKLSPDIMASLSRLTFSTPTPIQKAVIPEVIAGHDVVGKASTGSGKTLAFGIPIVDRFLETRTRHGERLPSSSPLALILSPTRELAHQLDKHISAVCSGLMFAKPVIATLTGGLSIQKQQRLLKDADIIIGTPGRLWEIISSGQGVGAALKQIQFLVIDEADRLLSEGHFKEVEDILNSLDRVDRDETVEAESTSDDDEQSLTRQTLVFSATFDRGLQKKLTSRNHRGNNLLSNRESLEYLLSKLNFREEAPKFIDVNPVNQLAAGLREGLVECGAAEKDLYLYALLLLHRSARALVFTNSISAVRRIVPLLQNLSLPVLALHSGMPQKARLRSVERFSKSSSSDANPPILIATDVAARGLDIPSVNLVIHYHLPRAADAYVHRSGRTARADQTGSSILICAPEEVAGVRKLVAQVHARRAKAESDGDSQGPKGRYFIRTLDIDRRVVSRLKDRVVLAKTLADSVIAKEKRHKEDAFLREAAEDLGVEYDSDDDLGGGKGRGRGGGRRIKEKEARGISKAGAGAMRAELRELLKQRVNVGVSERYLTSGRVDVDELLRQQDAGQGKTGEFLGMVGDLGMEID